MKEYFYKNEDITIDNQEDFNFIVNYDIKYRMGKELYNGD